jgi:amino acid transporter
MSDQQMGDAIIRPREGEAGLRGWMYLPAAVIILVVIGTVIELLQFVLHGSIGFTVGFDVFLVLFGGFAALRYFQEKKSGRALTIAFLIMIIVLRLLALLIFASTEANPDYINPLMLTISIVTGVVIPASCIAYLLFSKRVKKTLVN